MLYVSPEILQYLELAIMTNYFDVCSLLTQDIDSIILLHGARVMETVKPILDSETRTEDVKEQVKHNAASLLLPNK